MPATKKSMVYEILRLDAKQSLESLMNYPKSSVRMLLVGLRMTSSSQHSHNDVRKIPG